MKRSMIDVFPTPISPRKTILNLVSHRLVLSSAFPFFPCILLYRTKGNSQVQGQLKRLFHLTNHNVRDHLETLAAVLARSAQYFLSLGMYSRGSCRGIPNCARQLFLRSIQICLICISLRVQLVKVRQNLFISGESEPGSVPYAQPEIPIIRQQSTTQKYLNSGKQPFFTKLWQVMSIALAIKNRPKLCLVFFSRNITDTNPPKKPAIKGMYFCLSSLTIRLRAHSSPRKMSTKLPTNNPKFTESLLTSIFINWVGDLKMRFMPKTVDNPHLIRQLKKAIRPLSRNTPSTHPRLCLQLPVLLQGMPSSPRSCPKWERGSSGRGGWGASGWLLTSSFCSCCILNYPTINLSHEGYNHSEEEQHAFPKNPRPSLKVVLAQLVQTIRVVYEAQPVTETVSYS